MYSSGRPSGDEKKIGGTKNLENKGKKIQEVCERQARRKLSDLR